MALGCHSETDVSGFRSDDTGAVRVAATTLTLGVGSIRSRMRINSIQHHASAHSLPQGEVGRCHSGMRWKVRIKRAASENPAL